jgi:hypothetical protein
VWTCISSNLQLKTENTTVFRAECNFMSHVWNYRVSKFRPNLLSRLQVSYPFRQILGYGRDPSLQMCCCEARQQCQNRAKYIYKMCTFLRMQSVSYLNANFSLFARSNIKASLPICLKETRNTLMRLTFFVTRTWRDLRMFCRGTKTNIIFGSKLWRTLVQRTFLFRELHYKQINLDA